jgi:Tol biopolymer transport system component
LIPSTYSCGWHGRLESFLSVDGRKVVLSVGTIPASDIAVYDLKSHLLTKRTFNGQMNRGPLWSPDGKHILYVSQLGSGSSFWWVRADGGR